MNSILLCIIIIASGFIVGLFAGLVGIGGGSLIIPLFNLVYGLDILTATSTALFTVLPTSLTATITNLRAHTVNLKYALILATAGCICSPLGACLAVRTPDYLLSTITAVVLLIPMVQSLVSARGQRKKGEKDLPREIRWSDVRLTPKALVVCISTGAFAGFCSGLVGLGGGFIIIPVLLGIMKLGMHEVSATSVTTISLVVIPGIITHGLAGDIDWIYGILVACGSIPGAFIGARLSKKLDGLYLKYIFAVLLIVVSIAIGVRAYL